MEWLGAERMLLEQRLKAAVPETSAPPRKLHEAIRYSLLGGGKRLRGLLCRAAAFAIQGTDVAAAWPAACAVEMIHAYSLVHDDLPALDNDALRRGQPSCHARYGEALAILTGDALQTLAFEQLSQVPSHLAAPMVRMLARAAGTPDGMVAGQVADVQAEQSGADRDTVAFIHARKTAAMIRASVVLGGLAGEADAAQVAVLDRFGESIGLAFQITDDLLDVSGTATELGKTAGKDSAQGKVTYPAVLGVAAAQDEARRLHAAALATIANWPHRARLESLAAAMVERRS